jgi:alpha-tubulin suppressor-like RCC1 family protein
VYCWGENRYGQLGNGNTTSLWKPSKVDFSSISSSLKFKEISAGDNGSCAISQAGDGYCWGRNNYGQLGNSSNVSSLIPVMVNHNGALAGKKLKKISQNDYTTCAIAVDDLAYCWGGGFYGQLGNNTTTSSNQPVAVDTSGVLNGKTILDISIAGESTMCVLASDYLGYCWGENWAGELGNNSTTDSSVPVAVHTAGVLSGKTLKSIKAGYYHACAIASDDKAYCWGYNWDYQLGNGTQVDSSVPIAVSTAGVLNGLAIDSLKTNDDLTCALSGQSIFCWGDNATSPYLVDTSTIDSTLTINQLEMTRASKCVLLSDSQIYCIGGGIDLGKEFNTNYLVPTLAYSQSILNQKTISSIYNINTGGIYGHLSDGTTFTFGYGTLSGDNNTYALPIPYVKNDGAIAGKTIKNLATQGTDFCAVASDNLAYCWNTSNTWGSLGNGTTVDSTTAVAVDTSGALNGKTVKKVVYIDRSYCALASDDQVYCWGYNGYGILGVGDATSNNYVTSPQAISMGGALAGKTVKDLQASSQHVCILASDDWMYCWGWNGYGSLGDNTTTHRYSPTAVLSSGVLSGKTIKAMALANGHTCAIASDDLPYCWGYNGFGQLGNGNTTNANAPAAVVSSGVLAGKTLTKIAAAAGSTCVASIDDKIYCWGSNSNGQLGNNSTISSNVPVTTSLSGNLSISSLVVGASTSCFVNNGNQIYCWGSNSFSGDEMITPNFGVFYGLE